MNATDRLEDQRLNSAYGTRDVATCDCGEPATHDDGDTMACAACSDAAAIALEDEMLCGFCGTELTAGGCRTCARLDEARSAAVRS